MEGARKRYELTFPLKRIAKNKKLPYKVYRIGEVFRDEPVSSRRFRQFTQCDVDIVGSSLKDEAEIFAIASRILTSLGLKFIINFNSRKLLNEILSERKIGDLDKTEIIKEIDKLDKISESQIRENLKKLNADFLIDLFKKSESYFEKYKSYEEIRKLKEACSLYGIKISFQPSLARGLSYYNGSIFEIKSDIKETISAGGSYLINGIQSTGISFGLERLSQLAKIEIPKPRLLILSINRDEESIKLAERLRNLKKPCILMFDKITRALEYANSNGIEKVIIAGEDEKLKFKLRDMKTGKEKIIEEREFFNL